MRRWQWNLVFVNLMIAPWITIAIGSSGTLLGDEAFFDQLHNHFIARDASNLKESVHRDGATTLDSTLTGQDGTSLQLDPAGHITAWSFRGHAHTTENVEELKAAYPAGTIFRWMPSGSLISHYYYFGEDGKLRRFVTDDYPHHLVAGLDYQFFHEKEDESVCGLRAVVVQ